MCVCVFFFVRVQACPLNPSPRPVTGQQELLNDFSKRFSPAIRGVVEFAKRIPGFGLLAQDDQVTLLKAGVFEVLLVRLACMFDSEVSGRVTRCWRFFLLRLRPITDLVIFTLATV